MKNFFNKAITFLFALALIASIVTTTSTALACDDDAGNISLLWGSDKETEDEHDIPGFRN